MAISVNLLALFAVGLILTRGLGFSLKNGKVAFLSWLAKVGPFQRSCPKIIFVIEKNVKHE